MNQDAVDAPGILNGCLYIILEGFCYPLRAVKKLFCAFRLKTKAQGTWSYSRWGNRLYINAKRVCLGGNASLVSLRKRKKI